MAATGFPDKELEIAREVGRYEDEGWRVRKDGSRFWASVVITALFDATGRHRGFAKVTRDLTERRRATILEDEGRRITTFLAMLGHELRNPLAPIANALAIVEHPNSEAGTLKRMTGIISRQLKQITRLVDDLLDVGRITSGKVHLEAKPVKLSEVIEEAVEAVKPLADTKQHTIVLDAPDKALWISGDRARMIQVVCNLLNNAAKFTPSGGRIKVHLHAAGSDAEISVSDDGPGIPPQELPRIFMMFAQGEQDTSRSQGGLGLGLTLVQQLVALHGGEVSAFSKGVPGEGSEFVILLPTIAAPVEMRKADGPEAAKRVLIVDDNVDAAETMSVLIDNLGYAASTAFDGLSALEAIKTQQPDLVLMDIGLPGLSGVEVAQRVQARGRQSADPDRGHRLRAGVGPRHQLRRRLLRTPHQARRRPAAGKPARAAARRSPDLSARIRRYRGCSDKASRVLTIHLDGARMATCQPKAPPWPPPPSRSTRRSRSTSAASTWARSTCWCRKASMPTAPT